MPKISLEDVAKLMPNLSKLFDHHKDEYSKAMINCMVCV